MFSLVDDEVINDADVTPGQYRTGPPTTHSLSGSFQIDLKANLSVEIRGQGEPVVKAPATDHGVIT